MDWTIASTDLAAITSAFTTNGKFADDKNSKASSFELQILKFAVGILYLSHIFFVKIFEPSNCAAFFLGPNILIFFEMIFCLMFLFEN